MIEKNRSLASLNLSYNYQALTKGILLLVHGMKKNRRLHTLVLNRQVLHSEFFEAFESLFSQKTSALRRLRMKGLSKESGYAEEFKRFCEVAKEKGVIIEYSLDT